MSYHTELQSRGPGAIAAHDLGATPRFGSTLSRYGKSRRPRPVDELVVRRRRGAVGRPFLLGQRGIALGPPQRGVVVSAPAPRAPFPPGYPPVQTKPVPEAAEIDLTVTLGAGTTSAGLMPGAPPPTALPIEIDPAAFSAAGIPQGPSLQTAIAKADRANDAAIEADMEIAEITVPSPAPAPKKTPVLLYAGLGIAGWLLYRMVTR